MPDDLVRHTAALTAAVERDAPGRIELMPVGSFRTADARGEFQLDDPAAVIAASLAAAPSGHLCIDFGHGIHGGGEKRSAAAGWITGLEVDGERIMAAVDWTPDGAQALRDRAYRFVSPVFRTRGRAVALIEGAGLVNNPALPQLRQLASQQETDPMDLIKVTGALGLAETATLEDALAAIATLKARDDRNGTVLASVMDAAGVTDLTDETVRQLCGRVGTEPDPAAYVPRSAFAELTQQLASLQSEVTAKAVDAAVGEAMKAGKVSPGMEAWARQLAGKDMASFQSYVAGAPVIVGAERLIEGDAPGAGDGLSATERQICAVTGVDPEKFLATRKERG